MPDQSFNPNLYRGTFHPYHPRRNPVPPAFEEYILIGKAGNYASKLCVRVRPPTVEFPEAGLFLQLGNGKGTTFVRMSVQELGEVAEKLLAWLPKIGEVYAAQATAAENLQKQKAQIEQVAHLMEAMAQDEPTHVNDDAPISAEDLVAYESVLKQSNADYPGRPARKRRAPGSAAASAGTE